MLRREGFTCCHNTGGLKLCFYFENSRQLFSTTIERHFLIGIKNTEFILPKYRLCPTVSKVVADTRFQHSFCIKLFEVNKALNT